MERDKDWHTVVVLPEASWVRAIGLGLGLRVRAMVTVTVRVKVRVECAQPSDLNAGIEGYGA